MAATTRVLFQLVLPERSELCDPAQTSSSVFRGRKHRPHISQGQGSCRGGCGQSHPLASPYEPTLVVLARGLRPPSPVGAQSPWGVPKCPHQGSRVL